jgi:hypothetical protein
MMGFEHQRAIVTYDLTNGSARNARFCQNYPNAFRGQ